MALFNRISIVDDDTIVPLHDDEAELEEDLMPTEELPTIGGFLDERPTSVRELDKYRQSHRWRGLGDDEDEDADQDTESPALPSPRYDIIYVLTLILQICAIHTQQFEYRMEQKNKSQSSIKREPVVPAANTRSRVDSSDEEQRPTIKREPLSSTQSAVPSSVRSRIDADSDEEKGAPRPRSTTTGAKSAGARSRVDDSDEEPAVVKREKQPPARARIDNDSDEETPATTAPTVAISFKKRAGLMSRQEVSEDLRAARKQDTGIVDLTLIGILFDAKLVLLNSASYYPYHYVNCTVFVIKGKDAKTVVRKKPKEESEEERTERLEREAREALVKEKFQQLGKGIAQMHYLRYGILN